MITKREFWKYLTRVHRWAGLVLGLQILIWFSSGFFMSFFDIDTVRGARIAEKVNFPIDAASVKPLSDIDIGEATNVVLKGTLGGSVYVIRNDQGADYLNAKTGAPWDGLEEVAIRASAAAYYKHDAKPSTMKYLTKAPIEYRGTLPVWQVTYDDGPKTRLYLDANTGELKSTRTRLWRVFDFMWMLHIMDYDGRDDINNWWLWLASLLATFFALSGMGLVLHRIFLRPKAR